MGFSTPVSLLAAITETSSTSGPIIDFTTSGSTKPPVVTGIISTFTIPRLSIQRTVWRTEACSIAETNTLDRLPCSPSTSPLRARLFASVAPAVKITCPGLPPTRFATSSRSSSAAAA